MDPDQVVAPKVTGPPFVAPANWLEEVCVTDTLEDRVRPMALVRCTRGGNSRALYEIANFFKREQSEQESNKVAVIFVTFNDFSPVLEWEQADPRAALCRRIAFAAMKGRDYDHSLDQYNEFASAQVPAEEIVK